jgi:four helix bundle protein
LEVYQRAREFRIEMYRVARELPDVEKFGLASQIRRAAVSLTNNIAEGHGRFHFPDQIKFTLQARGSLEELIDDLNTCSDERYVELARVTALKEQAWRVRQLVDGYIRYCAAKGELPRLRLEKNHRLTAKTLALATIHDSRFNNSR